MNHFYIITNRDKDENLEITSSITRYIREHGKEYQVQDVSESYEGGIYHYTDPSKIPEETEVILVLGGDGTLIQAARDTAELDLPLLGMNLGHLGYLCELDKNNFFPALDKILANQYYIEERMMISGKVVREGRVIKQDISLNDIVIHRMGMLNIKDFLIYVNGQYLNLYHSDGVIISTPTGATGYSLSAGGPIVEPESEMLLITPMNPHSLNRRSIILSPRDEIVVEVGKNHTAKEIEVGVSFDGEESMMILPGDRVLIKKSERKTKILKTSKISFLETLCRKMQEWT